MLFKRIVKKSIFVVLLISIIFSLFPQLYSNNNNMQTLEEKPKISGATLLWNYTASDDVELVEISSDGNYIAAINDAQNTLYFFNKSGSEPLWTATQFSQGLDISSNGSYIVATGGGGNTKFSIFHKSSPTPIWTYIGDIDKGDFFKDATISADGMYIAVGTSGAHGSSPYPARVFLFNRMSNSPLWIYEITGDSSVPNVEISADGNIIAISTVINYSYSNVLLFNRSGTIPIWNFTTPDKIQDIAISSDGNHIVAGCRDEHLYCFEKSSSVPLWSYNAQSIVKSVDVSSDGNYIVAGSSEGVYMFHKSSSTPIWSFKPNDQIQTVALSSDGSYVIAGGENYVYFFNRTSSSPLWNYFIELGYIWDVAISSNGAYTVAGSNTCNLYLYDSFKITPNSFTLNSDSGPLDDDGNFTLTWIISIGADNYSVFQYSKYITEINESLTVLINNTFDFSLPLKEYSNGTYYFIAVAHNKFGNTLSNCIEVVVGIPPKIEEEEPSNIIPGYSIMLLNIVIIFFLVILIRKKSLA